MRVGRIAKHGCRRLGSTLDWLPGSAGAFSRRDMRVAADPPCEARVEGRRPSVGERDCRGRVWCRAARVSRLVPWAGRGWVLGAQAVAGPWYWVRAGGERFRVRARLSVLWLRLAGWRAEPGPRLSDGLLVGSRPRPPSVRHLVDSMSVPGGSAMETLEGRSVPTIAPHSVLGLGAYPGEESVVQVGRGMSAVSGQVIECVLHLAGHVHAEHRREVPEFVQQALLRLCARPRECACPAVPRRPFPEVLGPLRFRHQANPLSGSS